MSNRLNTEAARRHGDGLESANYAKEDLEGQRSQLIPYIAASPAQHCNVLNNDQFPKADTAVVTARKADELQEQSPPFLNWANLEEATLPPRKNLGNRSRFRRVLFPLNKVKAELPGGFGVEGLDGVVESVNNLFKSQDRLDYMQSERHIRFLPAPPAPGRDLPVAKDMSRRELERLENELFDLTKYTGSDSGACDFLTVLTWSSGRKESTGTITLCEADTGMRNGGENAAAIRPVAAMEEVPKTVLVKMRADARVKRKEVIAPGDSAGRDRENESPFEWTAHASPRPSYVRLANVGDEGDSRDEDGGEEIYDPTDRLSPSNPRGRGRKRDSSSHKHNRSRSSLIDADGIRATIPQFLALLHANRALVEDIASSGMVRRRTEDGEAVWAVALSKSPRPNSHQGDNVHVAVLVPEEAEWVREKIVWTDADDCEGDGTVEFRRWKFHGLMDREWRHPDNDRRSGDGGRGRSRNGRHLSPHS